MFIALYLTEKNEHQIRYYGYYSNKARGLRKKTQELEEKPEAETENSDTSAAKDTFSTRFKINWAMLIQLIYEIDPMLCPMCGGSMTVVKFIEKKDEIKEILKRCRLWEVAPARAPPNSLKIKSATNTRQKT